MEQTEIAYPILDMSESGTKLKSRSGALDLLRFIAVIIVFFGHYTDTFNYVYNIVPENLKYLPFSKYASLAMLIFFMVSGYVVTMTSVNKGIKDFAISRLSRLYPLFWISCAVAFIIPRLPFIQYHYLPYSTVKEFLVNLTMVPSVFGYVMINPVFHTLLIELLFYIFIALIIIFKWWNKITNVIAVMLALSLISLFSEDIYLHVLLTPFLGGMIFYLISVNFAGKLKLYGLLSVNFFCAIMSAKPLGLRLDQFHHIAGDHNLPVMIIIFTLIYLVFLLIAIKVFSISSGRILKMLGEIAYPFYLFHLYFLCFYHHFRNSIQADILLFGILFAAIGSSWLINWLIEKPLSTLAAKILYSATSIIRRKSVGKTELIKAT